VQPGGEVVVVVVVFGVQIPFRHWLLGVPEQSASVKQLPQPFAVQ
jgi:hypothetical protein